MAGIGFHCGKCRNGIAPPSRTPWTAATWVAASVPVVQLAATVCHVVVSAAFWMATGLGWSSLNPPAPEKRQSSAAREADSLPAPQLPHQLDGLDQSIVPFSVGPELGGPCLLVESFTGANTQEDPFGRQHGERGERLGDRCGMAAVDRAGHAGPVGDPTGSLADHCQSEPWKHCVALVVLPRLLM